MMPALRPPPESDMHTACAFVEPSLPAYFTRTERAVVYAPLAVALALTSGQMLVGWLTGHFGLVIFGFAMAFPCIYTMPPAKRALIARFRRRHARALWVPVALLLLLVLLPATGHAQDLGALLNNNQVAQLPASMPSPVDTVAWNIFVPLFNSLTLGVKGQTIADIQVMIEQVNDFFVPMCTIGVILAMLAEALPGANAAFGRLISYMIRAGIVMSFVHEGGHYIDWVVTPITDAPDQLVAALNGVNAGEPGHIYDVIATHYSAGLAHVANNLPYNGVMTSIISGVVLIALLVVCWPLCILLLAISFCVYVAYKLFLAATLVVGPIMIAVAMAGPLRGWTQGYVNALGSLVVGQVLLGVVLTFIMAATDAQTQSLINIAEGVNVMSSLGHAFASIVCMLLGAAMSLLTRSIAVGIVGGIYPSLQPFATAMRAAMVTAGAVGGGISSAAAAVGGGGGSSSGMATASMAIPSSAPGSVGNLAGSIRP